jgi:dUTP pyrophosphatase
MKIRFKKLHSDAIKPTKKKGDAGYDLYSLEDYTLRPLERKVFHVQIAVEIPEGYYGKISDRSGKALKDGLHVMGGVIDSGYRGSIGAILINLNGSGFYRLSDGNSVEIKKGDRIAQIIFEKYEDVEFEEVEELSETERADKGFNSSGN